MGQVDLASNNATLARAKEMNFAQAHLEIEAEFLVPPDSSISITSVAEADRAGIRIGVIQGSTTEARFLIELKNAVLVRAPTQDSAIKMLAVRQMDAFATNKANLFEMSDKLPDWSVPVGSRRLPVSATGWHSHPNPLRSWFSRSLLVRRSNNRLSLWRILQRRSKEGAYHSHGNSRRPSRRLEVSRNHRVTPPHD